MFYNKKEYKLFDTDFYQITMAYAYIMDNKANERTGYEGFVRNIKHYINPEQNYYKFSGANEVKEYLRKIRKELKNKEEIKEVFKYLLKDKIKVEGWEVEFEEKFKELDTNFEFEVVKEGSVVFPFMPVFQYNGPRWIGQMIETQITNIYNGKTGFATLISLKREEKIYMSNHDLAYLENIVFDICGTYYERYIEDLGTRAREYKKADIDGILLEAAYRRAPGKGVADIASKKALVNGWSGTSNTSIFLEENRKYINGTMAHAFVMSYETELEAFKVWDNLFPNSTILIDTYDTIEATKLLIKNNIRPDTVRIDSGDFFKIVPEVRKILDNAGWEDVKIFISGDITPELLTKLRDYKIPFDKSMAGTYYVYCNELIKKVNSGFVYKIVEYEDKNGVIHYPEKKAEGKKNHTGLKDIVKIKENEYKINKKMKNIPLNLEETMNFNKMTKINF